MHRVSECETHFPLLCERSKVIDANNGEKSDQMEKLERERAWREEEFDFILQYLRTILLKRE